MDRLKQTTTLSREFLVGQVLTTAELCLNEDQFKAFKKLLLDRFHGEFLPKLKTIMEQTGKGRVRAVPKFDNSTERRMTNER